MKRGLGTEETRALTYNHCWSIDVSNPRWWKDQTKAFHHMVGAGVGVQKIKC